MSLETPPSGYKYVFKFIDGQQIQALVPDTDPLEALLPSQENPTPWRYGVDSIHELRSLLRSQCREGDARMVRAIGIHVFWENSTDPTGFAPYDGQDVPGRWLFVTASAAGAQAGGGSGGSGSGDKNYIHVQSLPATSWIVNHNLGKFPAIKIIDSAGTEVVGGIVHIDTNQAVLSFLAPFTGTASCN